MRSFSQQETLNGGLSKSHDLTLGREVPADEEVQREKVEAILRISAMTQKSLVFKAIRQRAGSRAFQSIDCCFSNETRSGQLQKGDQTAPNELLL